MENIVGSIISQLFKEFDQYKHTIIKLAAIRASIAYINTIKILRFSIIGIFLFTLCLILIASGIILIHVSILLYAPISITAKIIISIGLGSLYILIPITAIMIFLSKKRWMKLFKANQIMDKILFKQ